MESPQLPKTKKLIESARTSIGVTDRQTMARIEIATLVQRYCQFEKEFVSLQEQSTELIHRTLEYEYIQTVIGLGDTTIIDLLTEIDSFAHYNHPRQLLKMAGLKLRENSSRQHERQKQISIRGRRHLLMLLFRVMMPKVRHNKAIRQLHEYYTTRRVNLLRKILVLCGKLLKVLYGICTKHINSYARHLMMDIP